MRISVCEKEVRSLYLNNFPAGELYVQKFGLNFPELAFTTHPVKAYYLLMDRLTKEAKHAEPHEPFERVSG